MKLVGEPQKVLDWFYAINQIPRPSYHEKEVRQFIADFAKERNLEYFLDDADNIIIKKPASPGYEDRPTVILQGHMDMVPEKTQDSDHDFLKDPIEMTIEDGWLTAKDTTLGADNGIAVAMAMAVLDSDDVEHGPLEVLFTSAEETGMDGAENLDATHLSGKYLLNIDTEEEDEFIVSCAGGCRLDINVPLYRDKHDGVYQAGLKIKVHNLHGGHSGLEIHKQRANANQIMARLLYELARQYKYEMSHFTGGSKHNAIPNLCTAEIAVKADEVAAIQEFIKNKQEVYRVEFTPQDEELTIDAEQVEVPAMVYHAGTTEALLSFLYIAPHGVIGMSQSIPNLVETSLNLAVITEEERSIHLIVSIRSSAKTPLEYTAKRLCLLAEKLDIKAEMGGSYPAWEYEPGSPLEKQAKEVYTRVFGKDPIISAIHAGLECGLLKKHLPHTQMISFGPDIEHAHTPKERANVASIKRVYEFLLELLKELK